MDILEPGANYQNGANAPRRQPIAQGYEPYQYQHRPQQPSYSYEQSVPPSLEKTDYYTSSTSDNHDIFTVDPYKPKKPWYRTKRGLLILFVVLLVVAGAAVGIVFGVRAAMNNANANRRPTQRGSQSGNNGGNEAGTQRGGGVVTTTDPNALPALPTLSLVTLRSAQQSAAATPSSGNLVLTLRLNPSPSTAARPPATAPAVNLANVAPSPTQVASTTLANVTPTPSVDPICARFPNIPSCKQG